MRSSGYSPYRQQRFSSPKRSRFEGFSLGSRGKRILFASLGALFALFLLVYLSLGELRFFANHALALGFFPKDYLILLQNDEELRPGGGFVTAYGELGVTLGIPSLKKVANSYEIEPEEPVKAPAPQEKLLKGEWYRGYSFRDANWNPDFPQASQELIGFYQEKFPENDVDGIFVMNFSVIEKLLAALGPVEVDGQQLDSQTLFAQLSQAVNNVDRHSEADLEARKDILGPLSQALMSKVKWNPFQAKRVLVEALHQKEAYLWLAKPRLQRKLEEKGWANHLALPEGSDFLALNFANLGAKKADRYVRKEAYWHADLSGSLPQISLEVTLRHPGKASSYSDDYKGYFRVYLPGGATTEDLPEGATVEREGDFAVIGQEILVKAGETGRWSYNYQLPRSLLDEESYRLRLVKQSGEELWLGASLEASEGTPIFGELWESREHMAFFRGKLEEDTDFAFSFGQDTLAPYPVSQRFDGLSNLLLTWNEPMDEETLKDALNYTLEDLDTIDSEKTDLVKVTYAEALDEKTVRLELEGATKQDLERYRLTLKGLRDRHGNATDPAPLAVTVVQR